jgi:hypothetical protein
VYSHRFGSASVSILLFDVLLSMDGITEVLPTLLLNMQNWQSQEIKRIEVMQIQHMQEVQKQQSQHMKQMKEQQQTMMQRIEALQRELSTVKEQNVELKKSMVQHKQPTTTPATRSPRKRPAARAGARGSNEEPSLKRSSKGRREKEEEEEEEDECDEEEEDEKGDEGEGEGRTDHITGRGLLPWTDADDDALKELVEEHLGTFATHHKAWDHIAAELSTSERSAQACKGRYHKLKARGMAFNLKADEEEDHITGRGLLPWTDADDDALKELVEEHLGTFATHREAWDHIAAELSTSERSARACEGRYYTVKARGVTLNLKADEEEKEEEEEEEEEEDPDASSS